MPSPYVKKGYGEVSKRAEHRIRADVIVKCKVCDGIMTYHQETAAEIKALIDSEHYYYCTICLRKVRLTQL